MTTLGCARLQTALWRRLRPRRIRRPISSSISIRAFRRLAPKLVSGWNSRRRTLKASITSTRWPVDSKYSLPYRGSQVLLAYDKTKLDPKDAPKSWEQLTAWIKANPGQFIYNRPDKGGSGGNFVRRAIHEANGRDPKKFTIDNFTATYASQTLTPAWALLNDLAPSLYQKGAYTAGNTQSIQLARPGRRDDDACLVRPGAAGDFAGRSAGDHRPRATG